MAEKYHVITEWMAGEGAYKMFQYSVSGDNDIGYADEEEAQKVVDFLNQETAPLHAEIERLQAENAKLRKFVQDVYDLEAVIVARTVISGDESESPWDGLNQANAAKAFMYDSWKEDAEELLAELEESEADNA